MNVWVDGWVDGWKCHLPGVMRSSQARSVFLVTHPPTTYLPPNPPIIHPDTQDGEAPVDGSHGADGRPVQNDARRAV